MLRRFGPAKASVVDVARALDVSHGSVYRHFPSKAALRDAVTERWLERVSAPLEEIVGRRGTASRRLHDWLVALAQDGGKGRQGRAWEWLDGNFAGSTLVRLSPGDPPAQTLSLAAGLALVEAIEPSALPIE